MQKTLPDAPAYLFSDMVSYVNWEALVVGVASPHLPWPWPRTGGYERRSADGSFRIS
jgi:hypothetical protein